MDTKILTRNMHLPDLQEIGVYESLGGYRALARALRELSPDDIVETVRKSGLRGRGGAGFPTGMKWGFVPKNTGRPVYLCVNSDESEPGTFKDRLLIEKDPHQLIEGTILSAYALGCRLAFLYIRGEYVRPAGILERAIAQARGRGYLGNNILGSGFDLDILVHRGAGAYICGEETALLESLEGRRGHPRLKPPFPAAVGLYDSPTVINNVETLANVPHIVNNGADWYAAIGVPGNAGTRLFGVSGHVVRRGVYELPMGTPLGELLYDHCGGLRPGRKLKAVVPGGSSTPVLTADQVDVPPRLRLHRQGREHAGLGRGDRHGRRRLHGQGRPQDSALLRRGIVRAVHPVPRGDRMALPHPPPDRGGARQGGGPGAAARPLRQHEGAHDLPPLRRRGDADRELRSEVPR